MASKVTTAPTDLEDEEGQAEKKPAKGGFIGGMLGRLKGMSRKQMMIYGGALLLVIGGGIGSLMFLGGGKAKEEVAAPKLVYHELPEMIVNLAAGNERPQYLRVKVTLEVEDAKLVEVLKPHVAAGHRHVSGSPARIARRRSRRIGRTVSTARGADATRQPCDCSRKDPRRAVSRSRRPVTDTIYGRRNRTTFRRAAAGNVRRRTRRAAPLE